MHKPLKNKLEQLLKEENILTNCLKIIIVTMVKDFLLLYILIH